MIITATEVVLIQLFSYTIVSKQQQKKMKTQTPSWHLHIIQKSSLLKARESHFSLVWLMECDIISPCFC